MRGAECKIPFCERKIPPSGKQAIVMVVCKEMSLHCESPAHKALSSYANTPRSSSINNTKPPPQSPVAAPGLGIWGGI